MSKHLLPVPRLQFFDSDGAMLVGGKLYTYEAGGTCLLYTSDAADEAYDV